MQNCGSMLNYFMVTMFMIGQYLLNVKFLKIREDEKYGFTKHSVVGTEIVQNSIVNTYV